MTESIGAKPGWPVSRMIRVSTKPSISRMARARRRPASSVSITTSTSTTENSVFFARICTASAMLNAWTNSIGRSSRTASFSEKAIAS